MNLYRCFIQGENFPLDFDGEPGLFGFFTVRFVRAETKEQAELIALGLLRADPKLEVDPSRRTDAAKVYFKSIVEIDAVPEGVSEFGTGYTFFQMEPEKAVTGLPLALLKLAAGIPAVIAGAAVICGIAFLVIPDCDVAMYGPEDCKVFSFSLAKPLSVGFLGSIAVIPTALAFFSAPLVLAVIVWLLMQRRRAANSN